MALLKAINGNNTIFNFHDNHTSSNSFKFSQFLLGIDLKFTLNFLEKVNEQDKYKILGFWKLSLVLRQKDLQIHVVNHSVNLTYWDKNFVETFFSQKVGNCTRYITFIPI